MIQPTIRTIDSHIHPDAKTDVWEWVKQFGVPKEFQGDDTGEVTVYARIWKDQNGNLVAFRSDMSVVHRGKGQRSNQDIGFLPKWMDDETKAETREAMALAAQWSANQLKGK